MFVAKKTLNNAMTSQCWLYSLRWSLTCTLITIMLCVITALFGVFLETNKHQYDYLRRLRHPAASAVASSWTKKQSISNQEAVVGLVTPVPFISGARGMQARGYLSRASSTISLPVIACRPGETWIPWNLSFRYIHCTGQFTPCKDESKCGTAFALIFGVNWLWRCGVTASFGVFFWWNSM